MRELARSGRAVSLADALAARAGTAPLRAGAVLVTFDDAYADFASRVAGPAPPRHPGDAVRPHRVPGHGRRVLVGPPARRAERGAAAPVGTPLGRAGPRRATTRGCAPTAPCASTSRRCRTTTAMALVDESSTRLRRPGPAARVLGWDALRALAAEGVTLAPHAPHPRPPRPAAAGAHRGRGRTARWPTCSARAGDRGARVRLSGGRRVGRGARRAARRGHRARLHDAPRRHRPARPSGCACRASTSGGARHRRSCAPLAAPAPRRRGRGARAPAPPARAGRPPTRGPRSPTSCRAFPRSARRSSSPRSSRSSAAACASRCIRCCASARRSCTPRRPPSRGARTTCRSSRRAVLAQPAALAAALPARLPAAPCRDVAGRHARQPNFLLGGLGDLAQGRARRAAACRTRASTHVHCHFANHPAVAGLRRPAPDGLPYSFTAHGSDLHVERAMLERRSPRPRSWPRSPATTAG